MKIRFGRRQFIKAAGAAGALGAFSACARPPKGRVVIVGGGFGGASCAKYINRIDPGIAVTLIERKAQYVTCPFSNNVLGGLREFDSIVHSYDGLKRREGITVIHDTVIAVDPVARTVSLEGGRTLEYDRLVMSPGIDVQWNAIEGYDEAAAEIMPHAWKAGPQTRLLQKQLAAMEDGGVVVISAPEYPYRCPPAPYERACMIAHYLRTHGKGRSKVLILDAKDDFTKKELFEQGWARFYSEMVEWIPREKGGTVSRVDPGEMTLYAEAGAMKADVANVVPPQTAGRIALETGLATQEGWCEMDPWTLESIVHEGIHVIGDSCVAGAMPKSGFSANSQAKACAATIAALLNGREPPEPVFMNTCYSTIAPDYGISINATYRAGPTSIVAIMGSGGLSAVDAPDWVRQAEYDYAQGWYASMMAEMFS